MPINLTNTINDYVPPTPKNPVLNSLSNLDQALVRLKKKNKHQHTNQNQPTKKQTKQNPKTHKQTLNTWRKTIVENNPHLILNLSALENSFSGDGCCIWLLWSSCAWCVLAAVCCLPTPTNHTWSFVGWFVFFRGGGRKKEYEVHSTWFTKQVSLGRWSIAFVDCSVWHL